MACADSRQCRQLVLRAALGRERWAVLELDVGEEGGRRWIRAIAGEVEREASEGDRATPFHLGEAIESLFPLGSQSREGRIAQEARSIWLETRR